MTTTDDHRLHARPTRSCCARVRPKPVGRRAHDRVAQPAQHPPQPAAARVRDDPADRLRADVPLRVRRRITVPGYTHYVDYLMPGIFVQTVVFGSLTTGVGLADDLQKGLIERFRSLPMARSAVLVGRTLADLVRNIFVVLLMAAMGFLVGWRIHTNVIALLAGLAARRRVRVLALVGVRDRRHVGTERRDRAGRVVPDPRAARVRVVGVRRRRTGCPGWLQAFAEPPAGDDRRQRGARRSRTAARRRPYLHRGDRVDRRDHRDLRTARGREVPQVGLTAPTGLASSASFGFSGSCVSGRGARRRSGPTFAANGASASRSKS